MSMSISDLPVQGAPTASPSIAKAAAPCPHGLRPGTTVCLHCLHDKRIAARNRRYKLAARIALGTIAVVVATAIVVGGLKSLKQSARTAQPSAAPAATKTVQPGRPLGGGTRPVLVPSIALGRTELGGGIFAERAGDSIVVHFDTDTLRTRFDWKFESVVRATLPSIFPQTRTALAAIPQGTLAHGDLLGDLTRRGIRLDLGAPAGGALSILPLTRQGQDGPLVVAYRVMPAR
jgi:hypothetical protein